MNLLVMVLQTIVAVGLLNVWLVRFGKSTAYRGGSAKNLKEEFAAYGLPVWFMYLIGFLKVSLALALLAGLWIPQMIGPAASLVVLLMLGALAMHLKVRDPMIKSLPAALMLIMALTISMATLY